jgi:hypothetical protein
MLELVQHQAGRFWEETGVAPIRQNVGGAYTGSEGLEVLDAVLFSQNKNSSATFRILRACPIALPTRHLAT